MVSYIRTLKCFSALLGKDQIWQHFCSNDIPRGADKSLARPGRKQATETEDFEFHISYL